MHNRLLHNPEKVSSQQEKVYSAEANIENTDVLCQVIPVTATAGDINVDTYGFIDQCASCSIMVWDLVERLGLTGKSDINIILVWKYNNRK